uniref:Large ribosomal subunit protein uL24c n=1 Tax=Thaumatella adunca TaxID=2006976 RepID=A0A1Z1MN59_9FLOR|nr:ribosomal protein L24 [Thaumatella adunca]ARW67488.1 ribosomal protein L24 [Thaumatella adunca]
MKKNKIQIKKGDTIQIISGKYKGKQGKINFILKNKNKVIIENMNMKTKHIKPKQTDDKGCIKQIEGPIHYSNIKLVVKA